MNISMLSEVSISEEPDDSDKQLLDSSIRNKHNAVILKVLLYCLITSIALIYYSNCDYLCIFVVQRYNFYISDIVSIIIGNVLLIISYIIFIGIIISSYISFYTRAKYYRYQYHNNYIVKLYILFDYLHLYYYIYNTIYTIIRNNKYRKIVILCVYLFIILIFLFITYYLLILYLFIFRSPLFTLLKKPNECYNLHSNTITNTGTRWLLLTYRDGFIYTGEGSQLKSNSFYDLVRLNHQDYCDYHYPYCKKYISNPYLEYYNINNDSFPANISNNWKVWPLIKQWAGEHTHLINNRSAYFSKEAAIWTVLQKDFPIKYDWLFWLDTDAIFFNKNKTAPHFLVQDLDPSIHLLIKRYSKYTADPKFIEYNAGVMIFRNNDWSRKLLTDIFYDYGSIGDNVLYNKHINRPHNFKHVKQLPSCYLNSFPQDFTTDTRFMYDDFLAHCAGDKKKKDRLLEYSNYLLYQKPISLWTYFI